MTTSSRETVDAQYVIRLWVAGADAYFVNIDGAEGGPLSEALRFTTEIGADVFLSKVTSHPDFQHIAASVVPVPFLELDRCRWASDAHIGRSRQILEHWIMLVGIRPLRGDGAP